MDLEGLTDELLTYIHGGERDQSVLGDGKWMPREWDVPMSYFNEAEPMLPESVGLAPRSGDAGPRVFFPDVTPRDLGGKWDSRMIVTLKDAEDDPGPWKFAISRFRSVAPRELRGKMPLYGGAVADLATLNMRQDGKYFTARTYMVRVGKEWRIYEPVLDPGRANPMNVVPRWHARYDESINEHAQMALGVAFSRYYEWRVVLGIGEGPTIAFATDPVGARGAFRLRDIPPGRERRVALRHWVSEHWRASRKDPAQESWVRAHLRGAEEFRWNGLYCKIVPSQYDVERALKIKGDGRPPGA